MATTLLNNKARKLIKRMIQAELERIAVEPGQCRWNFRCHKNAVHEAIQANQDKVVMCFYLAEDGWPTIHFLNYDGQKYVDNTLGHWVKVREFFFVRFIGKEDFFEIDDIFGAYRAQLRAQLPWWVRLLSNYEP